MRYLVDFAHANPWGLFWVSLVVVWTLLTPLIDRMALRSGQPGSGSKHP